MTADVDVAVVGAGAAGLAAAKRLQQANVSFRVLEARPVSGGRAWTDTETFPGIAFDRGCHWLHSASLNPLREAADRMGVAYLRQGGWGDRRIFDTDGWIGADRMETWNSSFGAALGAIMAMGRSGKDVAAIAAIDPGMPNIAAIRHVWTLMSSGELEQVSALDSSRYLDTEENYPVTDGLGALVQRLAAGVPVELAAPVTQIDGSDKGVSIATPKGTLRAKAVIVTASTNVLAQGSIRFTPGLPVEIVEALDNVPIGCAEKIAFLLDKPLEDMPANSFMTIMVLGETALNFYLSPFGRPLAVAFLGGDHGRALTEAGEPAMIDFARERLLAALGSGLTRRIRGVTTTRWAVDPFIRGGYSYARPGMAHMRPRLAEPFSDRIFLAGEATSLEFFSTAHGAHLTGIRAAERALKAIGADT
jgi:monoamine oxidase